MSSSGVLYVRKNLLKNGFNWQYIYTKNGKLKSIYDKSLFALKKKVKSLNLSWIIKDEEIYEENISRDLEEFDDFCVLDEFLD